MATFTEVDMRDSRAAEVDYGMIQTPAMAQHARLSALVADHNALAEAVHGLLGRVGMLEARVDYLEHGRPKGE